MAMNYLTVQDVINLHLRLVGEPLPFDYARLEEAVYYQYASGGSTDLAKQGARFLTGFVKMRPFESGNEACALAGLFVFLEGNGKTLDVGGEDAGAWAKGLFADRALAEEAIRDRLRESDAYTEHGVPDWGHICDSVLDRYKPALDRLAAAAPIS